MKGLTGEGNTCFPPVIHQLGLLGCPIPLLPLHNPLLTLDRKQSPVKIAHKGPCEGDNLKGHRKNELLLDIADQTENDLLQDLPDQKEVCPSMCPANYVPICGSDGNTYPNTCALKSAACK